VPLQLLADATLLLSGPQRAGPSCASFFNLGAVFPRRLIASLPRPPSPIETARHGTSRRCSFLAPEVPVRLYSKDVASARMARSFDSGARGHEHGHRHAPRVFHVAVGPERVEIAPDDNRALQRADKRRWPPTSSQGRTRRFDRAGQATAARGEASPGIEYRIRPAGNCRTCWASALRSWRTAVLVIFRYP